MRSCRGSLLVCEGLSGLGDTCRVKQGGTTSTSIPPPKGGALAEVVAIDEARVHLLPFGRLDLIASALG
jgi:hypothetical protein